LSVLAQEEGIIKYRLDFTPVSVLEESEVACLVSWQRILHSLELLGRQPDRYEGLAYGNLSMRSEAGFIISGTQCSDLAPSPEHYCLVTSWDLSANRVTARGPVEPSSECLTHAALYDADPAIGAIVHAHSAEIWKNHQELAMPMTDRAIAYGTPEMAAEVKRLYREYEMPGCGAIAMGGHLDGVLSFGQSMDQAGGAMVTLLARARQLHG
jgi:ribulose-5-phosphate 4-epimerase/fuculose-1-phosphate aldolase